MHNLREGFGSRATQLEYIWHLDDADMTEKMQRERGREEQCTLLYFVRYCTLDRRNRYNVQRMK